MNYTKIIINTHNQEQTEIIAAWLSDQAYLGIEEQENLIITYSTNDVDQHTDLLDFLKTFSCEASFSVIQEQNWNALWESNFEPVIIPGKIIVRAHFHEAQSGFEHEIKITPKMSFGTGHHATTKMMMKAMLEMDFKGKRVIDFGTGTGILAILAEQLGAKEIDAIDNDQWSVDNAIENVQTNASNAIHIALAENLSELKQADIILANINKHILLDHATSLFSTLKNNGLLLISGLLKVDYEDIVDKYSPDFGTPYLKLEEGEWIALAFKKG